MSITHSTGMGAGSLSHAGSTRISANGTAGASAATQLFGSTAAFDSICVGCEHREGVVRVPWAGSKDTRVQRKE